MTVTPDQAEEWLREHNKSNRPVREDRVDRYANLMKEGGWLASPDAIAFDYNDNLINGQHRLKGLVQSGEPQVMLVVWNLHPDAFMISDVGIKRTAADALAIEGFEMPQEMAATLRLVALWKRGELYRCNEYELVQNTEIVELATDLNPRIKESILLVSEHKSELIGIMPRSLLAFAHFVYEPHYGQRARTFIERFAKGVGVEDWEDKYDHEGAVSPVKLLRDKMDKDYRSSGKMDRVQKLGYLIQAMNWYCQEEPHKRLRYEGVKNYPEPAVGELPEYNDRVEQKELPGIAEKV